MLVAFGKRTPVQVKIRQRFSTKSYRLGLFTILFKLNKYSYLKKSVILPINQMIYATAVFTKRMNDTDNVMPLNSFPFCAHGRQYT